MYNTALYSGGLRRWCCRPTFMSRPLYWLQLARVALSLFAKTPTVQFLCVHMESEYLVQMLLNGLTFASCLQVEDHIRKELMDLIINYREDIDRQNLIDWVQADWVKTSILSYVLSYLHTRAKLANHSSSTIHGIVHCGFEYWSLTRVGSVCLWSPWHWCDVIGIKTPNSFSLGHSILV